MKLWFVWTSIKYILRRLYDLRFHYSFKYFSLFGVVYCLGCFAQFLSIFFNNCNRIKVRKMISSDHSWIVFTDGSQEYIYDILRNLNKDKNLNALLIGKKSKQNKITENINKIKNLFENIKVEFLEIDLNLAKNDLLIENNLKSQLLTKNISIVVLNNLYMMNKQFTQLKIEELLDLLYHNFAMELKIISLLNEKLDKENKKGLITLIHFDSQLSKFKLPRIQLFSACRLALTDVLVKERQKTNFKVVCYQDFHERDKAPVDKINLEHMQLKQYNNWLSLKNRFYMSMINSGLMISLFEKIIISNFYLNYLK
jgi:short-subunit dehydrogenase